MITQLYGKYFQKSTVFLYPLVGMRRAEFKPTGTFVRLCNAAEGNKVVYQEDQYKLLVMFDTEQTHAWEQFKVKIMSRRMFESVVELPGDQVLFVFNLWEYEHDVKLFLEGRYSELSAAARARIGDYFGIHTAEWAYIESFLYPEQYYRQYAKLLYDKPSEQERCEKQLRQNRELCDRYDTEKETFFVELPQNVVEQLSIL